MDVQSLGSEDQAAHFYDERYNRGYMDEWPVAKKRRVAAVINELGLPARGTALDFGCGNGVFTDVIKQVLPGWEVYGSDISGVSVRQARARFPACRFLEAADPGLEAMRFDFIFSHHVLEHVLDAAQTWAHLSRLAAPAATMLHILPCGNRGSLEWRLCALRENAIQPQTGNRFFYEDPGHLRRLTTPEMHDLASPHGFEPLRGFYANQWWGAVDWLTGQGPKLVRELTGPVEGAPVVGPRRMAYYRRLLGGVGALRRFPSRYGRAWGARPRRLKHWAAVMVLWPLLPFTGAVDFFLRTMARREWDRRRQEPQGSEMYLAFRRPGGAAAPQVPS